MFGRAAFGLACTIVSQRDLPSRNWVLRGFSRLFSCVGVSFGTAIEYLSLPINLGP
jgi:hypothetical protein